MPDSETIRAKPPRSGEKVQLGGTLLLHPGCRSAAGRTAFEGFCKTTREISRSSPAGRGPQQFERALGNFRGSGGAGNVVVEKTLDLSGKSEFGERKAALVDELAYAMRSQIQTGGPAAPFLEEVLIALRADELRLPVLPDSVSRVMRSINKADVDIGEVALLVALDPVLAVKIVGVANSAYCRGVEPVVSIRSALMRMGLQQARNVVVAVALRSSLFRAYGFESEAQAVWLHSLFSAFVTQALLREVPPRQDTGFLLGLIHDVGKIVVLSFAAERHSGESRHSGPSPAVVGEVEDLVHARLGALAVDSWGFSGEFTEVIANHHEPDLIKDHRIVLARALATADILAHHIQDDWLAEEGVMDRESIDLLEEVGVDEERGMELLREVHADFEALVKLV
jgi:HD-like signal output (HDOD) protein